MFSPLRSVLSINLCPARTEPQCCLPDFHFISVYSLLPSTPPEASPTIADAAALTDVQMFAAAPQGLKPQFSVKYPNTFQLSYCRDWGYRRRPRQITCSFLPPTPEHRRCDPMTSPWENRRIITLQFDEGGDGHARVCELVKLLRHSSLIYSSGNVLKWVVG